MIVLRWLLGIILGSVAAAVLFVLAALLAGPTGGLLGLLVLGFGLAFFPAVISSGTRTARGVVRRAAAWYAVLGLLIAGVEGYQVVTGLPLIPTDVFAFLRDVATFGSGVTVQLAPLWAAIVGVFFVLLSLILFLLLRPARPAATPPATRPSTGAGARPATGGQAARPSAPPAQVTEGTRPPAQVSPPASSPAAKPGLDDEDAQLLADLENLRQKLPKMGKE
jgi:hypothetical protein